MRESLQLVLFYAVLVAFLALASLSPSVRAQPPAPDVNCTWAPWGTWTACTVECGGGTKSRTREIQTPASGNGYPCAGAGTMSSSCNLKACPQPNTSEIGGLPIWVWIIIAVVAVAIVAGGVVGFVIYRRKKQAELMGY